MQSRPIDHYDLVETIITKTSDLAACFARVQQHRRMPVPSRFGTGSAHSRRLPNRQ